MSKNLQIFSLFSLLLACIGLAGMAYGDELKWLEVRVLDRQTGQAVENAAVCLGTTARYDQFGAKRADRNGVVRFTDLLQNPLLVTVSGSGYKGEKQLLEPMQQSRVLVLKLAPGGGGPDCDAAPAITAPAGSPALSISEVGIRADGSEDGAGRILLAVQVEGKANQIRVGERPDFKGSSWQAYQGPVSYTLSQGPGIKQVYVQIRRHTAAEGASIEAVSPVKQISYRVP